MPRSIDIHVSLSHNSDKNIILNETHDQIEISVELFYYDWH